MAVFVFAVSSLLAVHAGAQTVSEGSIRGRHVALAAHQTAAVVAVETTVSATGAVASSGVWEDGNTVETRATNPDRDRFELNDRDTGRWRR